MSGETVTITVQGAVTSSVESSDDAGLVLCASEATVDLPFVTRLPSAGLVIGRDPPPGGLRIRQTAVSRVHARLVLAGDGWSIHDSGSRNGTMVRGARVTSSRLEHRDLVHVGNALFLFVAEGASAFAAAGPARAVDPAGGLVGGLSLARIIESIDAVAPTDSAVLVLGETGTGKEVVARYVHDKSGRTGRNAAINCAAIPATLLESELFGVRRGAFTGADRDRPGIVRSAHGGTLLLDEIGDLPLEAQAKLLRFIETREVTPVGLTVSERVDVRLVAATNRDLAALVASGSFRADLFARLQQHVVKLPPLRERKEDIAALARAFLDRMQKNDVAPTFGFLVAACHYHWPFNVRELEAAVRRAVALSKDPALSEDSLPDDVRHCMRSYGRAPGAAPQSAPPPKEADPLQALPTPDEAELRRMLEAHGGNVAALARIYKKDRAQVHRWLRRYGIEPEGYR